jgi:pimeloyl-ACP methyl ester carboxylesterase
MKKISCLLLTGLLFACNSPQPASDPGIPSQKVIIEDQGVNIAYTDTGKGDTTLLFVHGWCIDKGYWSDQVAFFGHRYRVVTVDLPGFGQSGKNRTVWTTEMFGRDIDSVMARLNLKNVILVGHSMAGHIVLQAAVNAPDRVIGLVGVDNFKNVGQTQTPQEKAQMIKVLDMMQHNFRQLTAQYVSQSLFYTTTADSIRKRVLNDVASADSNIAVACLQPDDFNEVGELTRAKMKLNIISSDVKPTDTTGFKAHQLPYQVWYIHATGHYPMIEKPAEFNSLLEQAITTPTTPATKIPA